MILCCKWLLTYPLRKHIKVVLRQEFKFSVWSSKNQLNTCTFQCKTIYSYINTDNIRLDLYKLPLAITNNVNPMIFLAKYNDRNVQILRFNYFIRHYNSEPDQNTKEIKNEREEAEKKPSLVQRFKQMYKEYWYVLLPVHLITSAFWFSSFYYLAKSGVDIASLLESIGAGENLVQKLRNGHSTMGYLAVAYALYKIATPVRYTVTLGGTTLSIQYLKDWGYIKPIPPRDKLKEIINEKKENLKTRYKEKGFFDRLLTKLRLKKDNEEKD